MLCHNIARVNGSADLAVWWSPQGEHKWKRINVKLTSPNSTTHGSFFVQNLNTVEDDMLIVAILRESDECKNLYCYRFVVFCAGDKLAKGNLSFNIGGLRGGEKVKPVLGGKNRNIILCETVDSLVERITALLPRACELTAERPFGRVTDRVQLEFRSMHAIKTECERLHPPVVCDFTAFSAADGRDALINGLACQIKATEKIEGTSFQWPCVKRCCSKDGTTAQQPYTEDDCIAYFIFIGFFAEVAAGGLEYKCWILSRKDAIDQGLLTTRVPYCAGTKSVSKPTGDSGHSFDSIV